MFPRGVFRDAGLGLAEGVVGAGGPGLGPRGIGAEHDVAVDVGVARTTAWPALADQHAAHQAQVAVEDDAESPVPLLP